MQVRDAIIKELHQNGESQEVDLMQLLSRTALELIGQAGLGYSFENFEDETSRSEYTRSVKDLL